MAKVLGVKSESSSGALDKLDVDALRLFRRLSEVEQQEAIKRLRNFIAQRKPHNEHEVT